MNDLRQNIKRILLDESLPPDNMSARSATEVVERMKELSQNLGSAFGRLINETMIPLVSKILEVMDDRGIITLPLKVNGLEIKIAPVAPLAMAQNMEDVQNLLQYAQIAQQMPNPAMSLKTEEMMDYIADKLGIPQKIRPTPKERAMLQQQQQQAMQQQAMMQMAAENPEGVAEVAQAAQQG